jgi:hypothetical protein
MLNCGDKERKTGKFRKPSMNPNDVLKYQEKSDLFTIFQTKQVKTKASDARV